MGRSQQFRLFWLGDKAAPSSTPSGAAASALSAASVASAAVGSAGGVGAGGGAAAKAKAEAKKGDSVVPRLVRAREAFLVAAINVKSIAVLAHQLAHDPQISRFGRFPQRCLPVRVHIVHFRRGFCSFKYKKCAGRVNLRDYRHDE